MKKLNRKYYNDRNNSAFARQQNYAKKKKDCDGYFVKRFP